MRGCGWFALLTAAAFSLPAPAHAHIEVSSSSPERNQVLERAPTHLRILFSGRIEARYTTLMLIAPDGAQVPIGEVVFLSGSDREVESALPTLAQPGTYTVRWRTAGADGHVLEGSYAFVLAVDSAGDPLAADSATAAAMAAAAAAGESHADHMQHDTPRTVGGIGAGIGRGLHFLSLLLLLGAVAFRVLLMPRLGLPAVTFAVLRRRAWRVMTVAALLLAVAAVLRLWSQSAALHGAERAWSAELLSIMLTDTGWGRAWMFQALCFALLGMAIVWARPSRDRAAAVIAVPAVIGLSLVPAMSGHAAGATGVAALAVVNDGLHVMAAGAWLGTLALLMLVAMPVILKLEPDGARVAADAVDRFSPMALAGGITVMLTGLINSIMHLSNVAQLWTTPYGRVLAVKALLVALVMAAGFVNWRRVRPTLRDTGGSRRLRIAAGLELTFAIFVLIATAVLTGTARP